MWEKGNLYFFEKGERPDKTNMSTNSRSYKGKGCLVGNVELRYMPRDLGKSFILVLSM